MSTHKFEVGDRVECMDADGLAIQELQKGRIYTVSGIFDEDHLHLLETAGSSGPGTGWGNRRFRLAAAAAFFGQRTTPAHYDTAIQPLQYIIANKLGFVEGNVVKYVTRHRAKGGADDIRKAIDYLQALLREEYGQ
jgi:hypothetical protein